MKPTYYLFRSDKPEKKFTMLMPSHNHIHRFGSAVHRDYTLMNNKNSKFYEPEKDKREQVKTNYLNRHKKEPKGEHTPSSMADLILWSKPTLKGGIKVYERKFGVKIIFSDTKLTGSVKKELMGK